MANLKISELPNAVQPKDTDIMPIVQETTNSMITNKITVGNFLNGTFKAVTNSEIDTLFE